MIIGLTHYLVVSAILFTFGIAGIILNRKNIIVILMSVELILLSVNLNFVAFSAQLGDALRSRQLGLVTFLVLVGGDLRSEVCAGGVGDGGVVRYLLILLMLL